MATRVTGSLKFPTSNLQNPIFNKPTGGLLGDPFKPVSNPTAPIGVPEQTTPNIPSNPFLPSGVKPPTVKPLALPTSARDSFLPAATTPPAQTATAAPQPTATPTAAPTSRVDLTKGGLIPDSFAGATSTDTSQILGGRAAADPLAAPIKQKDVSTTTKITPAAKPAGGEPVKQVDDVANIQIEQDQSVIDDLASKAGEFLNATQDPNTQRNFNQAISNIGAFNQAQRDILQQQINQSPELSGQPAGNALLSMLARQQGFDMSNIVTNLSREAANAVKDLNRFGFEKSAQIEQFRENKRINLRGELLQSGDIDAYASQLEKDTGIQLDTTALNELSPATQQAVNQQLQLMNAAIDSGNLEQARLHFDTVVGLSPNAFAGADFDSLGANKQSFLAQSAANEKIEGQVRLDIAQGDLTNAEAGIETLFDEQQRLTRGTAFISSKSLEEINAALEFAGKQPVSDKSELIGREDEVFTASKMQEIDSDASKNSVDAGVDFFTDELGKVNPGVLLDEDADRLIRSFVLDLQTGGEISVDANGNIQIDPNQLIPPWDEQSNSSHQFFSWPVLGVDGEIVDESEFYTESNPRPTPDSELGKYADNLDREWEKYLQTTPKDEQLTRLGWFHGTQGGTAEVDPELVPEGEKKAEGIDLPGEFGAGIETREDLLNLGLEWSKLLDNVDKLEELRKDDLILFDTFNEDEVSDRGVTNKHQDLLNKVVIYEKNGEQIPITDIVFSDQGKSELFGKNNRRMTAKAKNLITGDEIVLFDVDKNASDFGTD